MPNKDNNIPKKQCTQKNHGIDKEYFFISKKITKPLKIMVYVL